MVSSMGIRMQVEVVQSRKLSILEIRSIFYELRQKIAGKSNGPREVRDLIKQQSHFKKISEFKTSKSVSGLWVPENEELLIRLLRSKIPANRLFIGPNIAIEKPVLSELILRNSKTRVLVPSQSMKEILLRRELGYLPENILVWFAGVDHRYWNPVPITKKQFVLVYQKGPDSEERVKAVEESLQTLNLLSVKIIYGNYKQDEYLKLLNECKFVIWVGHTETQGIAQFQAWAMNVPTLVSGLPEKRIREHDGLVASAAPYLSGQTGVSAAGDHPTLEEISSMNESLASFSPRKWVIENATREISISNLVKIFDDNSEN